MLIHSGYLLSCNVCQYTGLFQFSVYPCLSSRRDTGRTSAQWLALLQNPSPVSRVEFRLVMRVGSVQETEQQKGCAHFLEHVAFGGTTHFPKRSLVEYLESQGMKYGQDINAFTGFDRTIYMFAVPTDHQKEEAVNRSLLIMRDWLDGISMNPETARL